MPYERPYRDPRKKLILDDLWAADAIEIVCKGCGRQSALATHEMHARFRDTVAVEVIVAKATCSSCGGKEVTWSLLRARPPRGARGY